MVKSPVNSHDSIKFLCSYGGRILPRYPDAKLRYHGGHTRILSVHRRISFSELLMKLGEMCGTTGTSVSLRCQLPAEDLDALVSITSDEDLANLIDEYDRAAAVAETVSPLKIRAFLSAPKMATKSSSPPSSASSSSNDSSSPKSPFYSSSNAVSIGIPPRFPGGRSMRQSSRPPVYPMNNGEKAAAGKTTSHRYAYPCHHHHGYGNGGHVYVIHNGNYQQ